MNLEQARKRFIPLSETMLYILLSLKNEMHGYGIMQNVNALTDGRIELGAGTVYQTLSKLENGGLIVATDEKDRRKLYKITPVGIEILKEEKQRITEIYQNMEQLV
ncbi:MAG: PadR family transcriptional regulator [Eubacteriales bacterium]